MLKKMLALLMVIILLLGTSGCGGNRADNISVDNIKVYKETDIGEVVGLNFVMGVRVSSDGRLVVYTADEKGKPRYAILDRDGKESGSIECSFKGDGSFFALDEDDNLHVLVQSYTIDESTNEAKEITRQLITYDLSGALKKTLNLGKVTLEGGNYQLAGFETDSAGNIYLLEQYKNVEVFDNSGRSMGNIGSLGYSCMTMDAEGCLVLGSDGMGGGNSKRAVEKITTPKGEKVWENDPGFNDIPRMIKYSRWDKCTYILTDSGVNKYSADGEDLGYVFDTKQTSLSGFNSYITGMDRDSSGCFYFTVIKNAGAGGQDRLQTGLYMYTPQTGGVTSADAGEGAAIKRLVLSGVETNRYLENAISEFQKKYPDIRIEMKESPPLNAPEAFEKLVSSLNTELMSGDGPDIISASILPNTKYISGGVYANLSDLMSNDRDFDLSQYNTNIFDSFKYKSNMYVMPVSVYFEAIAVNQAILDESGISIDDTKWTWTEFLDICKKVTSDTNGDGTPDRYALPYGGSDLIMEKILSESSWRFIDRANKKADLDSHGFIDALQLTKGFFDSNVDCTNKKAAYMKNDMFELFERNTIAFAPATIYAYGTMGFYSENTVFLQPPSLNGEYKPSYTAWMSFAINEKSKYREEAWTFIKFMISKELQIPLELNGFVVNKEADAIRREMEINNFKDGDMTGAGGRRIAPMTENMLAAADRFTSITGQMYDTDWGLMGMLAVEAGGYIMGEKSAESAAESLQNKVSVYLNE